LSLQFNSYLVNSGNNVYGQVSEMTRQVECLTAKCLEHTNKLTSVVLIVYVIV